MNCKCLECVLEGVVLDFVVVVNGGFGLISEDDVLYDVCSCGVVGVDSVVVVRSYRSLRVVLVVLMVKCAVVMIMKDNVWEIVEDRVNVVVFVEGWVGGLTRQLIQY